MTDKSISDVFGSVGQPTDVFRPPLWRIGFGVAVMGVMGLAFLMLPFLLDAGNRNPPEDRVGMFVLGVGAMAIAVGIVVHGIRQRRLRAWLCPEALVVANRDGVDVVRWNEIVAVRETKSTDHIYFIPIGTYRAAEIESADGTIIRFDRNRLRRVGELIDAIQQKVWQRKSNETRVVQDARLSQLISAWPNISEVTRARIIDLIETQDVPTQR